MEFEARCDLEYSKICRKCHLEKPICDFYKKARCSDGHDYYCKSCVHEYNTSEKVKARNRIRNQKPDIRNQRIQYAKSYNRNYYLTHEEKFIRYRKASKQKYSHKRQEYNSRYRKSQKGKATEQKYKMSSVGRETSRRNRSIRRASGYVSPVQWKAMIELANNACVLCGKKTKHFHIDHWIPVTKNGKTELGNLIPLCRKCNQTKSNKDPIGFVTSFFGDAILRNAITFLEKSKSLAG